MERRNNRTNRLIMWFVILGDFVLLNTILFVFINQHDPLALWNESQLRMFFVISNMALLIGEWKFHSSIHLRLVSAADVLRKIFMLSVIHAVIAYMLLKHVVFWMAAGETVLYISSTFFLALAILRFIERNIVKSLRKIGRNTRDVTLVGTDNALWVICEQMLNDPTTGYRIQGYYADEDDNGNDYGIKRLGTIEELLAADGQPDSVQLGDEMYVCLSRKKGETIRALAQLCDRTVTKFFFVPVSVESIGLNLTREYFNDIEIYTTHESLLENPLNNALKRVFDIITSLVLLALTGLIFPIVYLIVKIQSPGPIFFKQLRTGINGKDFVCYKFRSMHVNKDADRLQATKDDPRKYAFGNFMRKTNIDELPQFWNVLIGNMSVVGPRPHMLAHTDMYSKQIEEYMVRLFVKPGITGWAQVTGFRGETKELWQMEERVKRDIWYIENWTIWLDLRIVWMTVKNIFRHDEHAY